MMCIEPQFIQYGQTFSLSDGHICIGCDGCPILVACCRDAKEQFENIKQ